MELGVQIIEDTPVDHLVGLGDRIVAVSLATQEIQADSYIVAAGAWSGQLVKPLIGWLPLEPAKGYSVTYPSPRKGPNRPLMLVEKHVIITPFQDHLRLTTGLDLVGFDERLDGAMIEKLQRSAARWIRTPGDSHLAETWFGYRPLSPDDLPIVGNTMKYRNLYLATGHGQLGMTLAPITGELLASQIMGTEPPMEPGPLSPSRFGL